MTTNAILQASVRLHRTYKAWSATVDDAFATRLAAGDERGDVAPRTVGIAVMAALAISIGAIITAKVTAKANGINL
jgi:hypothetical protein